MKKWIYLSLKEFLLKMITLQDLVKRAFLLACPNLEVV